MNRKLVAALAVLVAAVSGVTAVAATTSDQTAQEQCQEALGYSDRTVDDSTWLSQCVHALTSPTPVATTPVETTAAPTTAPATTPPSTPPETTPPPTGCPAYPSMPTPSCTGYSHTGVNLTNCPTNITVSGTYDSCQFNGNLTITVSGVSITRSFVNGTVNSSGGTLRGATFTDVEVASNGSTSAGMGSSNYTCIRCYLHNGIRGFALGSNVTILDSYAGGFHAVRLSSDPSGWYHSTGASTHGGSNVRLTHNWILCDSDNNTSIGNPQCSTALSVYGDDSVNNNVTLEYNRFDSGSSYCVGIYGLPGKPYDYTNVHINYNVFGNTFEPYWNTNDPTHAPHRCTEYGFIGGWVANSSKGNTATGNIRPDGSPANL